MAFLKFLRRLVRLLQVAVDLCLLVCLPVALALFVIFVVEEKIAFNRMLPLLWGPQAPFFLYAAVLVLLLAASAFLSGFLLAWDWTGKMLTRKKEG